jgi:DNA-binding NtrC family response regulator
MMAATDDSERLVVIVEDEPLVRMYAEVLVEELGLPSASFETADAAYRFLDHDSDHVRVVFTDVSLPGTMSGLQLAGQIYERWPWMHTIIVSGNAQPPGDHIPPNARFMPKPWRALDVIAALAP